MRRCHTQLVSVLYGLPEYMSKGRDRESKMEWGENKRRRIKRRRRERKGGKER